MEIMNKGKEPVYADTPSGMQWTSDYVSEESIRFLDVTEELQRLYLGDDNSTSRGSSPLQESNITWTPEDHTPRPPRPPRPGARKTRTAPPGPLKLTAHPPESHRRAISARQSQRRADKENQSREISPRSPRVSAAPEHLSKSMISRRKSARVSGGRIGLKPKVPVWRAAVMPQLQHAPRLSSEARARWWAPPQRQSSLSSRPRIREALQNRRAEMLSTGFVDFTERALPETPGSMVTTPRELYQGWTPDKPSPQLAQQRRVLQPTTPNKGRARSSPLTPSPRICPVGERRGSSRWKLRTGSTLTIVSPEGPPWRQNVYIPGPIQLENQLAAIAMTRKESIATLDPFLSTMEKDEPRRPSDDAVINAIVEYFEEFCILDPADEAGLDHYWERATSPPKRALPRRPPPPPALMPSALSVLVPSPRSSPRSPMLLSGGSTPRLGGRRAPPASQPQRIKLRRLLGAASSIL